MTHISKVTKSELAAQVAEYDEALALVSDERDSLATQLKAEREKAQPASVLEAEALAGCIRALDLIKEANKRSSNSYNTFSNERAEWESPVRRLLVHLADRYGVSLIERTTEPCSRQHLDDVDPLAFTSALRGAVMQR